MPNMVKIAQTSDLSPGTGKVVQADGKAIALFNVDGNFYAIDNTCPHRAGSLGQGALDGSAVTCPRHGWQFDVTTGDCLNRRGTKIDRYAVQIDGEEVLLTLPDPVLHPKTDGGGQQFLVRFGTMGYVGRFEATGPVVPSRGGRVAVRTSRGVEVGEVMLAAAADEVTWEDQPLAGQLLRLLTPEDELMERGLRDGQDRAFEACRRLLAERQLPVELVDAEQLLDGETLIFYFLGEATPKLADVKAELGLQYESHIEFRQFAEQAAAGCGPGCGTDAAPGCGSHGDDAGCAVGGDCNTCHTSEELQERHSQS